MSVFLSSYGCVLLILHLSLLTTSTTVCLS